MVKKASSAADPGFNLDDGLLRFELSDGKSNKFWEIQLQGSSHTVTYGRIGTSGQSRTKDFANETSARASAEKLIAEKTKKGYQHTSGQQPRPSVAAKKTAKTSEPAAAPAATSEPDVVLEVTSEIDLQPRDWHRAMFRKRTPLPLPEEEEFDYDACQRRLTKLKPASYFCPFENLILSPAMSPEEAHYWWHALSQPYARDFRQLAKVPPRTTTGRLSFEDAEEALRSNYDWHPEVSAPLYRLLGHSAFVELMLSDLKSTMQDIDAATILADGFVNYVLPYLSNQHVADLRTAVKSRWPSLTMPEDLEVPYPAEVYLAAGLGMHDEILGIVAAWDDSRYGIGPESILLDECQRPQDLVLGLGSPELVAGHWRRLRLHMWRAKHVRGFLACTELSALDLVAECIVTTTPKQARDLLEAFMLVRAPEAAEPMLSLMQMTDWVQKSGTAGLARRWLDKYVGNAIAGLVGTATGRGKLAAGAVEYLRNAKHHGYVKLIEDNLLRVDDETAEKLREQVLNFKIPVYRPFSDQTTPRWLKQELDRAGEQKVKPRPLWAAPDQLPPLAIGEDCLNPGQVETVLQTLHATILPCRHPLLDAIKSEVDEPLRDAFAWRLFERWQQDGSDSKEKWAMCALGHLGGDQSAIKLAPLVRTWPGLSQHPRAVLGLECLRAIGSDVSLMQLNGIAQKLKFQALKKKAREFMEEVAEQRGMTRAELEDLIVPDLDLDECGTRTFDFGGRVFQFVLKPDLKPAVRDGDGKFRGDLPRPARQDDEAKAKQAIGDWKLLKKNLREAIKIQVPRLEQAMVTGRRWSFEQFNTLLLRHPLMINFVRMLLWGAYDRQGKLKSAFRVTEERDFADVNDQPCQVPQNAQIGIVHALSLSNREAAAWGEVFSDYEIASPFPQIGRRTYTIEKCQAKETELAQFHNLEVPAVSLVGTLEMLGWVRGVAEEHGYFREHSKPFHDANVTAIVWYSQGIPTGHRDGWEDQTITECFFIAGSYQPSAFSRQGKSLPLGEVDRIVLSEVTADLHMLASKGK